MQLLGLSVILFHWQKIKEKKREENSTYTVWVVNRARKRS